MKKRRIYRHGDVNLIEIEKPEGKKIKSSRGYILARGEVTGSIHKLEGNVDVYENEGRVTLELLEDSPLTHTRDHEPLTIESGTYRQVPEREVDHFASVERKVTD
jgi:hypothetical protein